MCVCPYNLMSSFIVSHMYMCLDYIIMITMHISRFDTVVRRNETFIFIIFIFIISYPLYGFLRVQGISLCHFLNTTLHLLLCVRFVLKCWEELTLLYLMFLIPGNLLVVSMYNKSSFFISSLFLCLFGFVYFYLVCFFLIYFVSLFCLFVSLFLVYPDGSFPSLLSSQTLHPSSLCPLPHSLKGPVSNG